MSLIGIFIYAEGYSDILNSNKPVSIKTTPNLKAVWAECPIGYDVGVFVKVSVPEAVFITH